MDRMDQTHPERMDRMDQTRQDRMQQNQKRQNRLNQTQPNQTKPKQTKPKNLTDWNNWSSSTVTFPFVHKTNTEEEGIHITGKYMGFHNEYNHTSDKIWKGWDERKFKNEEIKDNLNFYLIQKKLINRGLHLSKEDIEDFKEGSHYMTGSQKMDITCNIPIYFVHEQSLEQWKPMACWKWNNQELKDLDYRFADKESHSRIISIKDQQPIRISLDTDFKEVNKCDTRGDFANRTLIKISCDYSTNCIESYKRHMKIFHEIEINTIEHKAVEEIKAVEAVETVEAIEAVEAIKETKVESKYTSATDTSNRTKTIEDKANAIEEYEVKIIKDEVETTTTEITKTERTNVEVDVENNANVIEEIETKIIKDEVDTTTTEITETERTNAEIEDEVENKANIIERNEVEQTITEIIKTEKTNSEVEVESEDKANEVEVENKVEAENKATVIEENKTKRTNVEVEEKVENKANVTERNEVEQIMTDTIKTEKTNIEVEVEPENKANKIEGSKVNIIKDEVQTITNEITENEKTNIEAEVETIKTETMEDKTNEIEESETEPTKVDKIKDKANEFEKSEFKPIKTEVDDTEKTKKNNENIETSKTKEEKINKEKVKEKTKSNKNIKTKKQKQTTTNKDRNTFDDDTEENKLLRGVSSGISTTATILITAILFIINIKKKDIRTMAKLCLKISILSLILHTTYATSTENSATLRPPSKAQSWTQKTETTKPKCNYCKEQSIQKNELKKHRRKTEKLLSVQLSAPSPTKLSETEKPLKGDECRKPFSHIINTKTHKKSQTRNNIECLGSNIAINDPQTEREETLKSERCNNLFGCKSKLKKHKKNHAPVALKRNEETDAPKCSDPDSSSLTSAYLKGERREPQKSDKCFKLFGCMSDIEKHKRKHAPTTPKYPLPDTTTPTSPQSTGGEPFIGYTCKTLIDCTSDMRRHKTSDAIVIINNFKYVWSPNQTKTISLKWVSVASRGTTHLVVNVVASRGTTHLIVNVLHPAKEHRHATYTNIISRRPIKCKFKRQKFQKISTFLSNVVLNACQIVANFDT